MKIRIQILSILLILISITWFITTEAATNNGLKLLIPEMEHGSDWYQDGDPHYFTADNLFEYINGSADLYLAYDFQRLITVTFLNPDYQSLTIDIYDMGNEVNAFGVYSNFRNPQDILATIGTDAIISDYYIRFYHGQYVVDLNASDSDEPMKKFMMQVAAKIEQNINAPRQYPDVMRLLPEQGVIRRTQKYISEAMLGHKFLPRGLEAEYKLGKGKVKAFIVFCDSSAGAQQAMNDLKAYISKRGTLTKEIKIDSIPAMTGEIPYHDKIIFTSLDSFMYGIMDLPSIDAGLGLMRNLHNSITGK